MILSHKKFDFKEKCLIEKVEIQAPFRHSVDFHNEACFIFFAEGETRLNAPDGQVALHSQDSIMLKCGNYFADLMKTNTSGRFEIVVVHLYPDILRELYKNQIPSFVKKSNNPAYTQKVDTHETLQKFIDSLYYYFNNPALVSEELLELKVKELILLLVQSNNANSIVSLFNDLFTPRQISIKEVVHNHLYSGLSTEDMAQLANVSVSTFKRKFYEIYQDTPSNYIKSKRLEHARELIVASSLTISEVAYETGFHDIAHFSRSFKQTYGQSPSDFRQSQLNKKTTSE